MAKDFALLKTVFRFLFLHNIFKANRSNAMIVAVSIGIGMVPLVAPNFRQWMPHSIHPLIESGILLSSLTAVLLNLFFNGASGDAASAVEAARQAEAH